MSGGMRIQLLGQVSVADAGEDVPLPSGRVRAVLAMLALHRAEAVSRDRLIGAVWGESAPATVATQLQGLISALRRALPDGVIRTHGQAYRLDVPVEGVDLAVFEAGTVAARSARATGDLAAAAEAYRSALDLWKGPALDGLDSPYLSLESARLEQRRIAVIEEWADVALALGQHAAVVDELAAVLAEDPARESVCALLMMAHQRAGRRPAALATFQATRRALVETLGVEPGADLQRLHRRILAGDPTPTVQAGATPPPRAVPRPAQLPRDIDDFTGRAAPLAALARLLSDGARVVVVAGTAGVGKTTIAVRAAHAARETFADGQFFVDLRGASATPAAPADVLSRLLRDLGVNGSAIPIDVGERAALYRSMVADRRMLLVLDDARGAAQVRPLIPAGAGCTVLITSRNRLSTLEGCRRLDLDVMSTDEAHELLSRIAGASRTAAEPDATSAILDACGGLPLAVRLAAARIAGRQGPAVASFAERLTDTVRRLDELHDDEDRPVRATFTLSYANLASGGKQLAFRTLGLWSGPDLGLPATAALLGWPVDDTERALEALVDVHLVQRPAADRYRLHDLLHVFAAERADDELSATERTAAVTRILDWYLHAADRAAAAIAPHVRRVPIESAAPDALPGFTDPQTAFAWFDVERHNLAAAVRQAGALPHEAGWKLPLVMRGYFHMRARWEEGIETYLTGLDASRRAGDRLAEAQLLNALGVGYRETARYDEALEVLLRGLECCEAVGAEREAGATMTSIANTYRAQGDSASAVPWYERSLGLRRSLDDQFAIAATLNDLGQAHYALGAYGLAIDNYLGALDAARRVGHRNVEAAILDSLGEVYGRLGDLDRAVGYLEEAIRICRDTANLRVEAIAMDHLAQVYRNHERLAEAGDYWRQALAIFESLGHPLAAEVSQQLARLHQPA